ncbi:hypothetical protein HK098_002543 [Nowakowskiella sp. JEL0407]|nr:hypothetical protein HK098_002543 [Nowakowskiella sp. JEL0407]
MAAMLKQINFAEYINKRFKRKKPTGPPPPPSNFPLHLRKFLPARTDEYPPKDTKSPGCAVTQLDKNHKCILNAPDYNGPKTWFRITEKDLRFNAFYRQLKKPLETIDVCAQGALIFSRKGVDHDVESLVPLNPVEVCVNFMNKKAAKSKPVGKPQMTSMWSYFDTIHEEDSTIVHEAISKSIERVSNFHLEATALEEEPMLVDLNVRLCSNTVSVSTFRKILAKKIWDYKEDSKLNLWALTLFFPLFVENPDTFHVPNFMLFEKTPDGKEVEIQTFGKLAKTLSKNFIFLSTVDYQGIDIQGLDESGEFGTELFDLLNHDEGTDLTHLFLLLMMHGLLDTMHSDKPEITAISHELLETIGVCLWKMDVCPGFLSGCIAAIHNWEGQRMTRSSTVAANPIKFPEIVLYWVNNAPNDALFRTSMNILGMLLKSGNILPKLEESKSYGLNLPELLRSDEHGRPFLNTMNSPGNDIPIVRLLTEIIANLPPSEAKLASTLFQATVARLERLSKHHTFNSNIILSKLRELILAFDKFLQDRTKELSQLKMPNRIIALMQALRVKGDIVYINGESNAGLAKTKYDYQFDDWVNDLLHEPVGGNVILPKPLPNRLQLTSDGADVRSVSDDNLFHYARQKIVAKDGAKRDIDDIVDLIALADATADTSLRAVHRMINGWTMTVPETLKAKV